MADPNGSTERRALGLVGLACRAGRVAVGATAVRAAGRKGRLGALVVARDASPRATERLGGEGRDVPWVRIGSREELGSAVGRPVAALVGITDRELAGRIVTVVGRHPDARDGASARQENPGGSS